MGIGTVVLAKAAGMSKVKECVGMMVAVSAATYFGDGGSRESEERQDING